MNPASFQDTRSTYKNQLYSYSVTIAVIQSLNGHSTGQLGCRIFPPSQKVLLDSTALTQNKGSVASPENWA